VKRVELTTLLQSPIDTVFAVVMSPESAHLIDPAVRSWTANDRPIGVGTRFAIRGRLGRVPIRGTSEVVIWDPPTLAEFRSVSPSWPMRMTARHSFEPAGPERTRYTWAISFEEMSIVARPLITFGVRRFEIALRAQAAALASYLAKLPSDAPLPAL
jgi:hypothetical protein